MGHYLSRVKPLWLTLHSFSFFLRPSSRLTVSARVSPSSTSACHFFSIYFVQFAFSLSFCVLFCYISCSVKFTLLNLVCTFSFLHITLLNLICAILFLESFFCRSMQDALCFLNLALYKLCYPHCTI